VARLGVARTFQQVSVFPRLSALENLLVFLQQHQEEHLLARLLRTRRLQRLERRPSSERAGCSISSA